MQPALLKAGISIAVISVAGFIYARIMARKSVLKDYSLKTQVSSPKTNTSDDFKDEDDSFHCLPSTCIFSMEDVEIGDNKAKIEEILGLRSQIEDLGKREWELEKQFIRYCDLKEQEAMLMELKNMLLLEKTYVEFLDREISWVETDNEILDNLVVQFMGVLEQLEQGKSENRRLQRKVKRLLRRIKEQSRVMRKQNMKIEAREAAILRNYDEIETRNDDIKKLEEEVRELHKIMVQMQDEKIELLKKLEMAEKSAPSISKIEGEGITKEAYNELVNELEQLQKDRAAEVKELIFLRWSNACLRHELMKNHEKTNHSDSCLEVCQETGTSRIEHELDGALLEHNEPCSVAESSEHACGRRGKLLQRLRRWVEGSEKARGKPDEKRRHESKCSGRHTASDTAEEHLPARRSCSSAEHGL